MATETIREKEGERECDSVAKTENRGKGRHLEKKLCHYSTSDRQCRMSATRKGEIENILSNGYEVAYYFV